MDHTTQPHELGQQHAREAIAAARAAGITLSPDAEGAWVAWDYSPAIPYAEGTREHDAYTDGWYEAAHDTLTA